MNVNHRAPNQETPVWVCAKLGYLEVLQVIKEFHETKPVNLAVRVKDENNSRNELAAIDISIRNGHAEVAEFLRAWEASFPKPLRPLNQWFAAFSLFFFVWLSSFFGLTWFTTHIDHTILMIFGIILLYMLITTLAQQITNSFKKSEL